ncbi:FAD-dependent monooxygenase [Nonomuraea helvata]|uniref:FAD-dependent monooxygenase n=1 Tax=Nonomuraea helvata TaxID=37484 RepID=A0ABV5S8Q5_9ACTN
MSIETGSGPGTRGDESGDRTAVLVVGGSVVGLSAAALLARYGVPCVLVEKHRAALIHPRARGFNPRTIEIFRQLGVEDAVIAAAGLGSDDPSTPGMRATTLSDPDFQWFEPGALDAMSALSPCAAQPVHQDRVEEVLRRRAIELGADIRFGTRLVGLDQDPAGVTATVRDGRGVESVIRADHLIAADGSSSPIRRLCGIPVHGPGTLFQVISLMFEADLSDLLNGRRFNVCYLDRPSPGTVLAPAGEGRWSLATRYLPEHGETLADYPPERCRELIAAALGDSRVEVRLLPQIPGTDEIAVPFVIGAQVAERFRHRRVFLAGDAAHVVPPTGGFGANTGIQDAHNLAWKIAAVHHGQAGHGLLDTYHAERHPVASYTLEQALARAQQRTGYRGTDSPPQNLDPAPTVIFGYRYRSAAILDAPSDDAPAIEPTQLTGRPGTRAPHLPVLCGPHERSTLDLYGDGFVLLAGPDGDDWVKSASEQAGQRGIPLSTVRIGTDIADPDAQVTRAHGITATGALLIRPDGFVAWRSATMTPAPHRTIADVLERVLCTIT